MTEATAKKWTKEEISALLQEPGKKGMNAIGRALCRILENQTADEQASECVTHDNGMGFRPCDARMGTSMAKFYKERGFLSEKQLAYWRKPNAQGKPRICVYAAQLAREVKAAAAAKEAEAKVKETA